MKKKLNNNTEIYNYLNITNTRLGKLYKYTGAHCLPNGFDVNEKAFKERILLNEMQNNEVFPPFVNAEKKEIKKHLKNSLKNIQKLKKATKKPCFSQKFENKFDLYLDLRHELTHSLLKDFNSQDCDEVDIYRQIFNLDPVLGEFLDGLFNAKADFSAMLDGLEKKYEKSYQEKLKALEKKKEARKKKAAQHVAAKNLATARAKKQSKTNSVSSAKKVEKRAKTAQKSQNLADAQKVRNDNKKNLQKTTKTK